MLTWCFLVFKVLLHPLSTETIKWNFALMMVIVMVCIKRDFLYLGDKFCGVHRSWPGQRAGHTYNIFSPFKAQASAQMAPLCWYWQGGVGGGRYHVLGLCYVPMRKLKPRGLSYLCKGIWYGVQGVWPPAGPSQWVMLTEARAAQGGQREPMGPVSVLPSILSKGHSIPHGYQGGAWTRSENPGWYWQQFHPFGAK